MKVNVPKVSAVTAVMPNKESHPNILQEGSSKALFPDSQKIGLGLRNKLIEPLLNYPPPIIDFLELAPENWIQVGGRKKEQLQSLAQKFPMAAHGLSLSLGGNVPIDRELVHRIKNFLDEYHIDSYSEHLSFCRDEEGYLYDLLPIPFTEENVLHISKRIAEVQDQLERTIAVENSTYYFAPHQTLSEIDFITAVINESGCNLLLDVNNLFVNSQNHAYDPLEFLRSLPETKIAYIHVAGHQQHDDALLLDTHGSPVIPSVFALLEKTYQIHGVKPTVLERDNQIPALSELMKELHSIHSLQQTREPCHAEL